MPILSTKRTPESNTRAAIVGYLEYALGEVVLVVVGILIALQINDWYQEQPDRKSELEYLVSMKRDLTEDTRELREAIDGNSSLLEGLNETLGLLSQPQDRRMMCAGIYRAGLFEYPDTDVSAATAVGELPVGSYRGRVRYLSPFGDAAIMAPAWRVSPFGY